jgi:hypothetical protein
MSKLLESVEKVVYGKTTPHVSNSVRALEELPGLQDWSPTISDLMSVAQIVSWGFPLSFVQDNESFDQLRGRIGAAISKNGVPNSSDLSEISAVALACACGATKAENVNWGVTRTPDFLIGWDNDVIEMEVTRAGQKQTYIDRQELARKVSEELHAISQPFDLIVHIADDLSDKEVSNLKDATAKISLSDEIESPHKWSVAGAPITRQPGVLFTAGQHEKFPSWWPAGSVNSFCNMGFIDAVDSTTASPQVKVTYGVPVTRYINPIQRKARRAQGSGTLPFIVALDVRDLHGAFKEFRRIMPDYFKIWPHLSGVLIYTPILEMPLRRLGWKMELLVSTQAENPLPEPIVKRLHAHLGAMDVWADLTFDDSTHPSSDSN